MKSSRSYKVFSCSGMTDPDLPSQDKCPFYATNCWNYCALSDQDIENGMIVPEDCLLRKFNIEVSTEVLNQTELEL